MAIGFIVLFMTLLEVAFLALLGRAYWAYLQLKKRGIKTQGEIIDYDIIPSNSRKKTFFPIIKFRTYLGQEINQKSLYSLDASQYLEKGSKVDLVYLENEPTRFMIDLYNPTKTITIVFVGFIVTYLIMLFLITNQSPTWIEEFMSIFK